MSQEEKALELLGANVPNHIVAATLGVTESRVSQMLSQEDFAAKVAERRYNAVAKYNSMDDKYNNLEDKLLDKLEKVIPLMVRPRDILEGLSKMNAAKRRGMTSPDQAATTAQVINLTVPVTLVNKFKSDARGQIVEVTDGSSSQTLVTATMQDIESLAHGASERLLMSQEAEALPARLGQSSSVKRANSAGITVEDL